MAPTLTKTAAKPLVRPLHNAETLVNMPYRLHAEIINIGTTTILTVRRCKFIRETSPLYAPVARFLRRHRTRVVQEFTEPDPVLDGRRAYVTSYEVLGLDIPFGSDN